MSEAYKKAGLAFLADIACVVVFVLIGEREHDSTNGLLHFFITFSAFGAALCTGWAIALVAGFDPFKIKYFGLTVWASTIILGHLFRVLMGGTTAVSFIIVSTIFLGLFFLGWRAIVHYINRNKKPMVSPLTTEEEI